MIAVLEGRPDAPLYLGRAGMHITRGQLRAVARDLAGSLSDAPVLNLCDDRAAFATGLLAAGLRGVPVLLPPARDASTLAQLRRLHPKAQVLADTDRALDPQAQGVLRHLQAAHADSSPQGLSLDTEQLAALAYTSGSTGQPKPVEKRWCSFAGVAQMLTSRLSDGEQPPTVVATVPPQHMYGLECSVLLPLFAGWCVHRERPFYPVEIAQALRAAATPRVLVSTPVHLKALLQSSARLPPLQAVVSATAPLSTEMAEQIETRWSCACLEIYGCTETGAVASRRTLDGADWQLFDGICITASGSHGVLQSKHLPQPEALPDLLAVLSAERFRLLGRPQDMINVGGRRFSVTELTQRLLSISGVEDAVVWMPDTADQPGLRPAALVVAPGMSSRAIRASLAERLEAVFLPRPLKVVQRIPRNATGKVRRQDLEAALQAADQGR